MPAQLSGLQTFGGGPPAQSNALPNTPFNSISSSAGTGVGNLGQFGGYIPTPLPQFNNYADYLSIMPGADMMSYYANVPVQQPYNPGQPATYASQRSELMNSPWNSAYEFAQEMDPIRQQYLWGTVMPDTARQRGAGMQEYGDAATLRGEAGQYFRAAPQFLEQIPEFLSRIPGTIKKADDIWTQGADPQQALYNRTQQQLQEQTRAGLEARGIDMSPYGAGVESGAMSNFNIDWQNNLLQRMLSAGQGYGQMMGTAGQELQSGAQAGQAGAQMTGMGSGLLAGAQAMDMGAAQMVSGADQDYLNAVQQSMDSHNAPFQAYAKETDLARRMQMEDQQFGQAVAHPFQQAFGNYQDIQNQFLTANQQGFNQNQTAGFEDPFAMLQLQSQIEMQREQMNMQEEMQKKQMQQQMAMQGMQAGMGMLGGMGGK